MPSVFLCHASEDNRTVEPVQLALINAGCKVFYDESSLPPGSDYYARIRVAIAKCDLFVFMVSPVSVTPGKFTLTELEFIRERWPSPVGRVLPVVMQEPYTQDFPAYLRATTVLRINGNLAAETRDAVESMLRTASRRRATTLSMALAVSAILGALTVMPSRSPKPTSPSLLVQADRNAVPETAAQVDSVASIVQTQSQPSLGAGESQAERVRSRGSAAKLSSLKSESRRVPILPQPPLEYALMDPTLGEIENFVRQNFPEGTRFTPIGLGEVDRKSSDHYLQIVTIGTLDSQGVARSEDVRVTFSRSNNRWEPRSFEIIKRK